ncbi:unnamed protein product [Caenorhabditis angaria]|uniref:Uncharacterized protein n=1 Tax=Caenorhabditis angaria TaxID=860376 RepID=A0A9P1MX55_9PELO|nr:unnamed protein product [Caenorhabditis angaria]
MHLTMRQAPNSDNFLQKLLKTTAFWPLFGDLSVEERKSRFFEEVSQRKLTLTFPKSGLTIPLSLAQFQIIEHRHVDFESQQFLFNDYWVTVAGRVETHGDFLTGECQFRIILGPEALALSDVEIEFLRNKGLPI